MLPCTSTNTTLRIDPDILDMANISSKINIVKNTQEDFVIQDASGNEQGLVPSTDYFDDAYYSGAVTIGTGAGQVTCNLDFDSGSADLWGLLP